MRHQSVILLKRAQYSIGAWPKWLYSSHLKHHGQAMRSPMRTEWIKRQGLEMQGLWSREVFQKVLRTSFTPQDRVFITRFNYTIKRKGGEFDKCKVRLVVQGQHMKRKGADGVGDYDDAFMCLLLAVSALFSVLPPNSTCLLIMSTFLKTLYKVNCYPGTVSMETSIFLSTGLWKGFSIQFIVSSSHFMACSQLPVHGIQRWALFWKEKAAKP